MIRRLAALATTAVCRDPNQPVIQWEAHNRNGLLHYIVPPLHSPQKIAQVHDKKHGRKVALYTAIPSILCLENGQFSFCRRIHRASWTWRPLASFDTIMEQNSFDKSSLQQDLLTSRFPATADDESSLGRQVASA